MVTLLYGPNAYRRDKAFSSIREKFLETASAVGIERFDGDDLEVVRLPELLQGASLFAASRLVVIRGASTNKKLWEALGDAVETVPDETHLVLIEAAPDKRTRTFKQLAKYAQVVVCDQPGEHELQAWLIDEASRAGKELSPSLARQLIMRVGVDQQLLFHELEKVLLSPHDITKELIDEVVESSEEGNAFALLDAVLAGQAKQVDAQLRALKTSEDPYRLIGLVTSQVFSLALVWAGQKLPPAQIAAETGLHPFVVKKLAQTAKRLTRAKLDEVVGTVVQLDDRLKTSAAEPWELLELALAKIASI